MHAERWHGHAVFLMLLALASCTGVGQQKADLPSGQIERMAEERGEARALFEEALASEGEPERSKELYLRALELDPSFGRAQNNLALLYLAEGDYAEAARRLREAVKALPGRSEPRFNLGLAYEQIGRLEGAEEQYRASVGLSPDEPDYIESLARVLIKRNEHLDEARQLLEKALGLESRPEHVEWIRESLEALRAGLLPRLPRN